MPVRLENALQATAGLQDLIGMMALQQALQQWLCSAGQADGQSPRCVGRDRGSQLSRGDGTGSGLAQAAIGVEQLSG